MSKKDLDIAKMERMFQHHSLDNLVFGSRSRSKNSKNEPINMQPQKKSIPAQPKGGNKKKKQTIQAKREEKKEEEDERKAKEKEKPKRGRPKEKKEKQIPVPHLQQKQICPEQIQQRKSSEKIQSSSPLEQVPESESSNQNSKNSSSAQESEKKDGNRPRRNLRKKKAIFDVKDEFSDEIREKNKKGRNLRGMRSERKEERFNPRKKSEEEKEYSINRIFRKTKKLEFPSFKLEANILSVEFSKLVQNFGHFDILHCSLPIQMLIKLPNLKNLIQKGFFFLWVSRGQIPIGYHYLNRLGFDVIDQIMWIKTNQDITDLHVTKEENQNIHSELFSDCRETCLIGYKCILGQKTQYCTKISNNLIFTPASEHPLDKPEEIYEIADLMMPGAKKIQIGYKEVGGWLTIKHKQISLIRCHQCLRKSSSLKIVFYDYEIRTECQKCLASQLQHLSKLDVEEKQKPMKKQIEVHEIIYFKESIVCDNCKSEDNCENGLIYFQSSEKQYNFCKGTCFVYRKIVFLNSIQNFKEFKL